MALFPRISLRNFAYSVLNIQECEETKVEILLNLTMEVMPYLSYCFATVADGG